ncbi:hypothetical protein C4D60_Mb05t27060 [Musa balbisiana]|uniref:Uncharacterized protein n=1 Tax=Musa balbisiana TaxID=52838 RepID=A0A4S8JZ53_MUSBA|nr:hypothetical protein C4D60_Mb05t27060 [Musa balbisiana]
MSGWSTPRRNVAERSPPAHTLFPLDRPPQRATRGSLAFPVGSSPITLDQKGSASSAGSRHKSSTEGGRGSFFVASRLGPVAPRRGPASAHSIRSAAAALGRTETATAPSKVVIFVLLGGRPTSTSSGVSFEPGFGLTDRREEEDDDARPPRRDRSFIPTRNRTMVVTQGERQNTRARHYERTLRLRTKTRLDQPLLGHPPDGLGAGENILESPQIPALFVAQVRGGIINYSR